MKQGCIIAAVVAALLIGVVAVIGYHYVSNVLDIPDEYAAYTDMDSTIARVQSKTPAPPDSARLDSARLHEFLGTLGPVAKGLTPIIATLDSLHAASGDSASVSLSEMPAMLRKVILTGPTSRRALVEYLNAHDISWAQYQWLKQRVILASGITPASVDSVIASRLAELLPESGTDLSDSTKTHVMPSFDDVEQLRRTQPPDSAEIALVRPYRDTLLTKGLATLVGLDSKFSGIMKMNVHDTP